MGYSKGFNFQIQFSFTSFNGDIITATYYSITNNVFIEDADLFNLLDDEQKNHIMSYLKNHMNKLRILLKAKYSIIQQDAGNLTGWQKFVQVKNQIGLSTKKLLGYDEISHKAFWTHIDFELLDEQKRIDYLAISIAHTSNWLFNKSLLYNLRLHNVRTYNLKKQTILGADKHKIITRTEINIINQRIEN